MPEYPQKMVFASLVSAAILSPFGCRCDSRPPRPTLSRRKAAETGNLEEVRSILYWSREDKMFGRVDAPMDKIDGCTMLHVAAKNGQVQLVEYLLEHGSGPDSYGHFGLGRTPLHMAAQAGQLEAVKALVARGAGQHLKDGNGKSCEQLARENGHEDVAEFLRKAGMAESGRTEK